MKTLFVTLLLVLCLTAPAYAEWSTENKQLFAVHSVLKLIDLRQTLDIANHADVYEINPILGKHPTDAEIYSYFLTSYLLTAWLVGELPATLDTHMLGAYIGIQAMVINNNYSIGLRINF